MTTASPQMRLIHFFLSSAADVPFLSVGAAGIPPFELLIAAPPSYENASAPFPSMAVVGRNELVSVVSTPVVSCPKPPSSHFFSSPTAAL